MDSAITWPHAALSILVEELSESRNPTSNLNIGYLSPWVLKSLQCFTTTLQEMAQREEDTDHASISLVSSYSIALGILFGQAGRKNSVVTEFTLCFRKPNTCPLALLKSFSCKTMSFIASSKSLFNT